MTLPGHADWCVVGAGLVGLATARALMASRPGARVVVLEKESGVGLHQSSHNSGVMHAGLHYEPGSLKARLAVEGIRRMAAFCREHGIAHEVCGKLVLATADAEIPRLRALEQRGRQNGLTGLTWIERGRIVEYEPHARGVAALHVPEEGIADYPAVAATLARIVADFGGDIATGAGVHGFRREAGGWRVETSAGDMSARFVIGCAGLHADRIALLAGERPGVRIVPFRGEYYKLRPERRGLVRNLIYPVPDPALPFLGVHFTRTVHGDIEAGPNAMLALAREGYRRAAWSPRDAAEALAFPGLWRFLARYPSVSVAEVGRTFSRAMFAEALARLVPDVRPDDLVPGGAGVRAQAMTRSGALVHDFVFLESPGALHVLNAPSPAATACLVIGEEIAARALRAQAA